MAIPDKSLYGERRIVQAMLFHLNYYDGPADGKSSQKLYQGLAQLKNDIGLPVKKQGEAIMVTPNGQIMQALRKQAPTVEPFLGDLKPVGKTGAVISCMDKNWKLNILPAEKIPLPKWGGNVNEGAIKFHKAVTDIWEETRLPFTLTEEDINIDNNGNVQFTLRLPFITWLSPSCTFDDTMNGFMAKTLEQNFKEKGFPVKIDVFNNLIMGDIKPIVPKYNLKEAPKKIIEKSFQPHKQGPFYKNLPKDHGMLALSVTALIR